jgi:hypothetical protein
MKRAVSISLGSSKRNKAVEITLFGEKICLERIGTDGDENRARRMFAELDGKVEAFGVGGIDLAVHTPWKDYPLRTAWRLVADVKQTPFVDGDGLKQTLERRVMQFVEKKIGAEIQPKTAFIIQAISRYGMMQSFVDAGYACVFGDLMSGLDIPIPVRSVKMLNAVAKIILPVVGYLPFSMLYPTGEKQEVVIPKFVKYYQNNTVTAGDFLYVKRHMPETGMDGKVVVTNTTTEADVAFLKARGIKSLVTTTPLLDGRTFGTNMMEAALVAASGKGRKLTHAELDELIDQLGLEPTIQKLN